MSFLPEAVLTHPFGRPPDIVNGRQADAPSAGPWTLDTDLLSTIGLIVIRDRDGFALGSARSYFQDAGGKVVIRTEAEVTANARVLAAAREMAVLLNLFANLASPPAADPAVKDLVRRASCLCARVSFGSGT